MSNKKYLQLIIGVTVSGAALWLALKNIPSQELGQAFSQVHWLWVSLAVAVKASILFIKDLRWKVELGAVDQSTHKKTFSALTLGYFFNTILPFKLGELIRSSYLRKHNPQLKIGRVISTIVAERVLDLWVLGLLVLISITLIDPPAWISLGTTLLLTGASALVAIAAFESFHHWLLSKIPSQGWGRIPYKLVDSLSKGTAVFRKPWAFSGSAVLTLIAWMLESLAAYIAFKALGVDISYWSCVAGTLLISIGLLTPSAPGQIGTHQALSVFIYALFGASQASAFSVSVVLQMVNLGVLCSFGAYILANEKKARNLVKQIRNEDKLAS